MSRRRPKVGVLLLLSVLSVPGCGGADLAAPPTTGFVDVTTSTTGAEPDPDGYTLQLDSQPEQMIGSAATLRLIEVTGGPHTVHLAGVAANCTVSGDNPRTVSVTAGETTAVTFDVACRGATTTGSLEVTSSTSGRSPDADGYTITLDGADRGPLGGSAGITLTGLTPGSHVVGLSGVAANCEVGNDNPRTVLIAAAASTTVAFSVTCTAPPPQVGTLRITAVTTGTDQDPDGYILAIDGGSSRPIGVNAVVTLASVAAGEHSVRLDGVASNCTVMGANPRAATVSGGTTAELSFTVGCTASTSGTPSGSKSEVAASPSTMNLQGTSEVTVTVRDGNGTPLRGVSVTLSSSGTGNTISPASLPTGTTGKATFTYTSTVAEIKTITARAGIVELSQKPTITVEKLASILTMSAAPNPSIENQTVRVTVFVEAGNQSPTGEVTVTVSGGPETCTAILHGQNGLCEVARLMPGPEPDHQRVITATYSGDLNCLATSTTEAHRVDPSIFDLVSVRDHIPGSFTVHRALYADRDRIYLGSFQGDLFVLARDRAADFPIIQTIHLGVPVTGVRGDADRLYVTAADGLLRIFAKGSSLSQVAAPALSTYLGTLEVLEDKIYVTTGAELAVDHDRLYLGQLNERDVALEVDKATLEVTRTYGQTFVKDSTVVFDRSTGAVEAMIPYPPVMLEPVGRPGLYLNGNSLMETVAGCCGTGITIVKAPDFVGSEFIPEPFVDAIAVVQGGFWGGMETGEVAFFDSQNHLVQKLNLRTMTGHTGIEDIELRSIWADGFDDLVFAASSWGNDASRSPTLPAFFVVRLK